MKLFFDLDGTLVDPRAGILDCIRHALRALDKAPPGEAELLGCIGPPLIESFRRLLGCDRQAEAALEHYRARYAAQGIFEAEVIAGIPRALETLSAEAEALYIVTSKPSVYAERVLDHFELAHHFDGLYGPGLDGGLNDKSALIAHLLRSEALADGRAIMIGDRRFDIKGAADNGLRSIGVLWGFGSRDELAAADVLCEAPMDLPEVLRRLASA